MIMVMLKDNDMKIAARIVFVCITVGCARRDSISPVSSKECIRQVEYTHGPAEEDTSIAARLAEDFMKTQADAKRYSSRATAVSQEEIGVYIVRFRLLDNSSKSAALVKVALADRR